MTNWLQIIVAHAATPSLGNSNTISAKFSLYICLTVKGGLRGLHHACTGTSVFRCSDWSVVESSL
jgi:hypothetical protein